MSEYKTREQKTAFYKSNDWRGKNGLREQALKRDNWECVMCRDEGKVTTQHRATLEVDHIVEIEINPKLAKELDNLRTLCKYHHNVRHKRFEGNPNKKKTKWDDELW